PTNPDLEVRRDRSCQPGPDAARAEDESVDRGDGERDPLRCPVERDEQRNQCAPGDPGKWGNRKGEDARHGGEDGAGQPPCRTGRAAHRRGGWSMRPSRVWWVGLALVPVVAIFAVCLVNSLAWIGRPFPGFLIAENGIVVSLGRSQWTETRNRSVPFARVLAVDGHPVSGGRDVQAYVNAAGVGKAITYTFRNGTDIFRLRLTVRPFRSRAALLHARPVALPAPALHRLPVHGERRPPLRRGPRARFDRRAPAPRADRPLARRGAGLRRHRTRDPRHLSAPATPDLSRRAGRTASPSAAARGRRLSPLRAARRPFARADRVTGMTLRSKLTLMFLGALQVTFLTAVGTFWSVQSW